jgi:hypothetical protein
MGFSTPKEPFDMKDFLSKKGIPKPSRYGRSPARPMQPSKSDADDVVETVEPTETPS